MAAATEFAHLGMSYFFASNCIYKQYIVAGFADNLFFKLGVKKVSEQSERCLGLLIQIMRLRQPAHGPNWRLLRPAATEWDGLANKKVAFF